MHCEDELKRAFSVQAPFMLFVEVLQTEDDAEASTGSGCLPPGRPRDGAGPGTGEETSAALSSTTGGGAGAPPTLSSSTMLYSSLPRVGAPTSCIAKSGAASELGVADPTTPLSSPSRAAARTSPSPAMGIETGRSSGDGSGSDDVGEQGIKAAIEAKGGKGGRGGVNDNVGDPSARAVSSSGGSYTQPVPGGGPVTNSMTRSYSTSSFPAGPMVIPQRRPPSCLGATAAAAGIGTGVGGAGTGAAVPVRSGARSDHAISLSSNVSPPPSASSSTQRPHSTSSEGLRAASQETDGASVPSIASEPALAESTAWQPSSSGNGGINPRVASLDVLPKEGVPAEASELLGREAACASSSTSEPPSLPAAPEGSSSSFAATALRWLTGQYERGPSPPIPPSTSAPPPSASASGSSDPLPGNPVAGSGGGAAEVGLPLPRPLPHRPLSSKVDATPSGAAAGGGGGSGGGGHPITSSQALASRPPATGNGTVLGGSRVTGGGSNGGGGFSDAMLADLVSTGCLSPPPANANAPRSEIAGRMAHALASLRGEENIVKLRITVLPPQQQKVKQQKVPAAPPALQPSAGGAASAGPSSLSTLEPGPGSSASSGALGHQPSSETVKRSGGGGGGAGGATGDSHHHHHHHHHHHGSSSSTGLKRAVLSKLGLCGKAPEVSDAHSDDEEASARYGAAASLKSPRLVSVLFEVMAERRAHPTPCM